VIPFVEESNLRGFLAPNPGPMTLDGTNTWIVGDPRELAPIVIDPGPADRRHLTAVLAASETRIAVILLTHRHLDHSEAAAELAAAGGCGVRAADPALLIGDEGLADGDRLDVGDSVLDVIATPGHTDDSICLLLTGPDGQVRLLTGDTVLGRGTTVIAAPDGDLGAYLRSLERMREIVRTREVRSLLPGHGPIINSPLAVLDEYLAHRQERLEQVRAAVREGATTAAEVVTMVYADVDRSLWPAAEQSVRAQLRYLQEFG
jgi:glyoxylase-like metal-dependent hydrolase (beta-lactamase superfamily II)